jgi:hypothetical protein
MTTMSKRFLLPLLAVMLFAIPLHAGFEEVVGAMERTPGLHRTPIPFFGLARFVVRVAHPRGVHDVQVATFEGGGNVDRRDMAAILRDSIRDGYSPIVQTRSRRNGEWTFIFARPSGETIDMLVVTHDNHDTTVVRAVVDAEVFAQEVNGKHSLASMGSW